MFSVAAVCGTATALAHVCAFLVVIAVEIAKPWLKRAVKVLVVAISTYASVLLLDVLHLGACWCVMAALRSVHWLAGNASLLCFVARRHTVRWVVAAHRALLHSQYGVLLVVLYCVLFNALAFALDAAFMRV